MGKEKVVRLNDREKEVLRNMTYKLQSQHQLSDEAANWIFEMYKLSLRFYKLAQIMGSNFTLEDSRIKAIKSKMQKVITELNRFGIERNYSCISKDGVEFIFKNGYLYGTEFKIVIKDAV